MPGEFMVPLKVVTALRDEFNRRRRVATDPAATVWEFCADRLQGVANDTRAAGTRRPSADDPTPEERAVARLLQVLAEQSDLWAEELTERVADIGGSHALAIESERDRVVRKAQRLWHALLIVMEHTGLGPEDMYTPAELARELGQNVRPKTGN